MSKRAIRMKRHRQDFKSFSFRERVFAGELNSQIKSGKLSQQEANRLFLESFPNHNIVHVHSEHCNHEEVET